MAANAGYATLQIIPSARGFGGKLQSEISGPMSDSGRKGGRLFGSGMIAAAAKLAGPIAAAFAGTAVFDFLKDAVSGASDLNETISKSDAIFGKNAKAMRQWSKTAATSLGLSSAEALDAAANFGDMFRQIGFTGDAAAKAARQVVQMSADLGSFNNLETADVAERISAAFRGEYDSLQLVIPNINAARVELEALNATGKESAKELTAQEKAQAILNIVRKDGTRAMGDFAKTSGSLANQQKILSAQWADMKAQVGQGLLPIVTRVVSVMNDWVPRLFDIGQSLTKDLRPGLKFVTDAAKTFVNVFRGGSISGSGPLVEVGNAAKVTRAVFEELKDFLTADVIPALQRLWETFVSRALPPLTELAQTVAAALIPAIRDLWSFLRGSVVPIIQSLAQIVMAQVVPAILALAGYVADKILPAFRQAWALVRDYVLPILSNLANFIVRQIVPAVIGIVKAVAERLRPVFDALVSTIRENMLPAWQRLLTKIREWVPTIKLVVSWVVKIIGWVLKFAAAILGKVLPPVIKLVGWLAGNLIDAIIKAVEFFGKIINWIGKAGKAFVDGSKRVAEFVRGLVQQMREAVAFVRSIPGKIKRALGNLGSLLINAGRDIIRGLIRGINDMVGAVNRKVQGIVDGIKSKITGALRIKSPSRVMMGYGRNIGEGLAIGMEQSQKKVSKAAQALTAFPKDAGQGTADAAARGAIGGDTFVFNARSIDVNERTVVPLIHGAQVRARVGRPR